MRPRVDISVARISHHAVCRYCERVLEVYPTFTARARAIGVLTHRMHFARPAGIGTHDGYTCHAWRLSDCVVLVKQGTVTTVLTEAMFGSGLPAEEVS